MQDSCTVIGSLVVLLLTRLIFGNLVRPHSQVNKRHYSKYRHEQHLHNAHEWPRLRAHAARHLGKHKAVQPCGCGEAPVTRSAHDVRRHLAGGEEAADVRDELGLRGLARVLPLQLRSVRVRRVGHRHRHALRPHLHLQGLREADEGELGGGVGGVAEDARLGCLRGHHHHPPARPARQAAVGRLHAVRHPKRVHPEHVFEVGHACVLELHGVRDARAAEEQIHLPLGGLGLGHCSHHVLRLGHIRTHSLHRFSCGRGGL
mmetsp:Transcript_13598/g.26126  ORF Transcript_13598/g.26126 Transcript_13598/m.26126 type:complete len:260 (-) Transcript_13598:266-1045(-)